MALLTAEVQRVKYELGYNALTVGADPWVGISQLFENVVAPYLQAGATTTSSTSVAAVSPDADPALASLTLASATGFAQFAQVVVDVDDMQESATVRSVSGPVVTLFLRLAHAGTYPVTVDGGEGMVREILRRIRQAGVELGEAVGSAGLKKVDEIEFFATGSRRQELLALREMWREELAGLLGVPYLRKQRAEGGSAIALF